MTKTPEHPTHAFSHDATHILQIPHSEHCWAHTLTLEDGSYMSRIFRDSPNFKKMVLMSAHIFDVGTEHFFTTLRIQKA